MAQSIGRVYIVSDVSAPGLGAFGLVNDLPSDSDTSDSDWEEDGRAAVRKVSPKAISIAAPKKRKKKKKASNRGEAAINRKRKKLRRNNDSDQNHLDAADSAAKVDRERAKQPAVSSDPTSTCSGTEQILSSESDSPLPTDQLSVTGKTWSLIPSELLVRIVSLLPVLYERGCMYLARCSQVCRHWRLVVSQSIVWKEVDLRYLALRKKVTVDLTLVNLLNRGLFTETKVLNLNGWRHVTDHSLVMLADKCFKLEQLHLSGCQRKNAAFSKISSKSLVPISEICPLRLLDLSWTNIARINATLSTLLINCGSGLVSLNLAGIKSVGSSLLTAVIAHCPGLEVLDLSNTSIRVVRIETLQNGCPKMRELYLADIPIEPSAQKKSLKSSGFPNLRVFSIGQGSIHARMVSDDVLRRFLWASEKLNTLDIRGCMDLTEESLACIPSSDIHKLFISKTKIAGSSLQRVCQMFPGITYLDLSFADISVTDYDVVMKRLGRECVHLEHVNLAGTPTTDHGVKLLLEGCEKMTGIDLTSCRGVSRGLKRLHLGMDAVNSLREVLKCRRARDSFAGLS